MLGVVVNGLYRGGALCRETNSKAMYIQTQSGERIAINKNTAISAKPINDPNAFNGQKAMLITWANGDTSTVIIGITSVPATNEDVASAKTETYIPTSVLPDQGIPTFVPPTSAEPTFTPPAAPKFSPPAAPKFTPPARPAFSGPACHFHPNEPAVRRCAKCGKPICKDCYDNYQVKGGKYAGKALCFDCCQELVQDNIQQLQENYSTIKTQYMGCLVGCLIGALIGLIWGSSGGIGGSLVYGILCAAIGGSASNFFRSFFSALPGCFVSTGNFVLSICIGLFKFIFIFFWYALIALFETIKKIIYYVSYMKKTEGFIESDTNALQRMKDYMEYTLIRSQNVNIDINVLLAQESKLADNSFAQMVREQGEEKAEAVIRGCTASINEHGEIIRSFAA